MACALSPCREVSIVRRAFRNVTGRAAKAQAAFDDALAARLTLPIGRGLPAG
jgi:hypothetical protein